MLPSSENNTCSEILSLKYQTGCWLFLTATCSRPLGGPGMMFWNKFMGRSVLADEPGCIAGTYTVDNFELIAHSSNPVFGL